MHPKLSALPLMLGLTFRLIAVTLGSPWGEFALGCLLHSFSQTLSRARSGPGPDPRSLSNTRHYSPGPTTLVIRGVRGFWVKIESLHSLSQNALPVNSAVSLQTNPCSANTARSSASAGFGELLTRLSMPLNTSITWFLVVFWGGREIATGRRKGRGRTRRMGRGMRRKRRKQRQHRLWWMGGGGGGGGGGGQSGGDSGGACAPTPGAEAVCSLDAPIYSVHCLAVCWHRVNWNQPPGNLTSKMAEDVNNRVERMAPAQDIIRVLYPPPPRAATMWSAIYSTFSVDSRVRLDVRLPRCQRAPAEHQSGAGGDHRPVPVVVDLGVRHTLGHRVACSDLHGVWVKCPGTQRLPVAVVVGFATRGPVMDISSGRVPPFARAEAE